MAFVTKKYPGRLAVMGGPGVLGQMIWALKPDSVSDTDRAAGNRLPIESISTSCRSEMAARFASHNVKAIYRSSVQ